MTINPIDVIVRFRVKPGNLELYKQAIDLILPIAEAKEPYVLEYNIYKNAEGVYTQYERYTDEAALHRHLEVTMDGQIKWAEAIEIEQFGPESQLVLFAHERSSLKMPAA